MTRAAWMAAAALTAALAVTSPAQAKPEAPKGCTWNQTPFGSGQVLLSLICEQSDHKFRIWLAKPGFTMDVMARAKAGDPAALIALADFYLTAPPSQIDKPQAQALLTQAAEGGSLEAMRALALALITGELGEPDGVGAVKWWSKAGEAGDATSLVNVGLVYERGAGLPAKDPAQAVVWYRKAAEAGDMRGAYRLGAALLKGDGVPKDEVEGRRWLQKAADAGDKDAAALLAPPKP